MPTRNHDIKPRPLPACRASSMARATVVVARGPSHRAGVGRGRRIASRLRVAAQQRDQRGERCSTQVIGRCASAPTNAALAAPRSNTAARTVPTLLVTGGLTVPDETFERAGLQVSQRVESVSRALRQRGLAVDALIAEVTSLHMDLATRFASLAWARRVRAAAIVYEYGTVQALALIRLAGFHAFRSVGGQIDRAFVLTKLQESVADTRAAKPTATEPVLPLHRQADGWATASPNDPSCAISAGSPVTPAARHACTRARERHLVDASPKWRRRRSPGFYPWNATRSRIASVVIHCITT
ncbi:hypothetical protein [Burkholderia diffusa]|uniref:hypothetical protein n=1 Tax=Burkholderia diffusa TaxID=488732 RepID=UPI000B2D2227|nr:hypothetical protein [Burkholderia diffusa]